MSPCEFVLISCFVLGGKGQGSLDMADKRPK